jgi:hypothetical protein
LTNNSHFRNGLAMLMRGVSGLAGNGVISHQVFDLILRSQTAIFWAETQLAFCCTALH